MAGPSGAVKTIPGWRRISSRVIASSVGGPAIIGKGAQIENAYIGPFTSIGDGVIVRGSEVEHSIILEGASISDIGGRIESSRRPPNASLILTMCTSAWRTVRGFRVP